MERKLTEVYCGDGIGKTTLAIGQSLRACGQGKSVIIIQFLKGRERRELDFLEELDNILSNRKILISILSSSSGLKE